MWKSMPAGFHAFVTRLSHTENRVRVKAKLSNSGVHLPLRLSCAEAMDEGGLPHPRVSQKHRFEQSLRTHTCLLQFRHKHPTYHGELF